MQFQFPPLAQNPDPAIFTHLNVLNCKCKDVFRYFWAGERDELVGVQCFGTGSPAGPAVYACLDRKYIP